MSPELRPDAAVRIAELIRDWESEAARLRQQAATYSPLGAKQARLRGEASTLDRCAQALKKLTP
jgi:hypothetical protein